MNKLDQGLRRCQRVTESSLAASPRWVRLDMACALFAHWEMPEPINPHLRIEKWQSFALDTRSGQAGPALCRDRDTDTANRRAGI
jgi:hypothetical protein